MKFFAAFFAIMIILTSCATFQKPKTLEEVRANLDCIEYKDGIVWKEIVEKFGNPDNAPLPEPGTDLTKNARVYKDHTVIFYASLQEIKEEEKIRFHEVVNKIEVCKEK